MITQNDKINKYVHWENSNVYIIDDKKILMHNAYLKMSLREEAE